MNDYLLKENERLNLNNISQKNQNEFNNSLYYFYNKLQSVEFDKIKSLHTEAGQLRIALNVIQLNYTKTMAVFLYFYKNFIILWITFRNFSKKTET